MARTNNTQAPEKEPKVDQTPVYPMPQSEQPHPVYGWDAPPETE